MYLPSWRLLPSTSFSCVGEWGNKEIQRFDQIAAKLSWFQEALGTKRTVPIKVRVFSWHKLGHQDKIRFPHKDMDSLSPQGHGFHVLVGKPYF